MKSDNTSYERYQRQTILKEFGEAGQQKLLHSKVLVIGAGGLGCPALQYLAAAGVGNIGIADDDVISLSNLHRQVLYSTFDIGFSKAEKAKHSLTRLNPDITIVAYNERLTNENAFRIIEPYDIVIDGTDNFASRYLINDACVLLDKPFVYGAVSRFEGQVAIFNFSSKNGGAPVNYRDLFPEPPFETEVLNCAEAGVLGVLPGIIGTMQANETIKMITGIGKPLINSLFTFNALNNQVYELLLSPKKDTRLLIPATEKAFRETNYEWLCSPGNNDLEIDSHTFNLLLRPGDVTVLDVREWGEAPIPHGINYTQIPLSKLRENIGTVPGDTVIVFCQSGKRSRQAVELLLNEYGNAKKIFSLKGGIINWLKSNSPQPL